MSKQLNKEYKTYYETFCRAKIIRELKSILKIGRNPLNRKRLNADEKKQIRELIKKMGSNL